MVLRERIKRIRTFRDLTQRELGLKLGYAECNADVRIAKDEQRQIRKNWQLQSRLTKWCQAYFYRREVQDCISI